MRSLKFAVLGAGHEGQTMAADIASAWYEVRLFEFKRFRESIDPILQSGGIGKLGVAITPSRNGVAEINTVTTCPEDGQMVVTWPDNLAPIKLMKHMKDTRIDKDVIVGGTASLIYACSRIERTKVWVRRIKTNLRARSLGSSA